MAKIDNTGTGKISLKRKLSVLGPGLITAALVFGPGSLTITSRMGALFGYDLFWVIVVAIFFMVVFVEMGARVGIVANGSLLTIIRAKWGRPVSVALGLGIFLITASFQAGNTIGASLAFAELFHTKMRLWIIVFTLIGILLLVFRSFYRILEKIMIALVGVMLVSFVVTLILAKPDLIAVGKGLVPSLPEGSELLSIALIASSFSIVGAFYQSYLVKEKGWKSDQINAGRRESLAGVLILGAISSFILINAAAVLHPKGIKVNSAADMGLALEPLYGNIATVIFMMGLFGASFSSLIGNATIGGALLSDAFEMGYELANKKVRLMIMLVMVIGAGIAVRFGRLPLELIIFAQAVTVIIAPLIGVALFFVANDGTTMGAMKNNKWKNIAGIIGLLLLVLLAINNVRTFLLT